MSLKETLQQQYAEMCAQRDEVNARNAPLEAELEKANATAEEARVRAIQLAAQIDDNRGREKWLALKKDIGLLAQALNKAR